MWKMNVSECWCFCFLFAYLGSRECVDLCRLLRTLSICCVVRCLSCFEYGISKTSRFLLENVSIGEAFKKQWESHPCQQFIHKPKPILQHDNKYTRPIHTKPPQKTTPQWYCPWGKKEMKETRLYAERMERTKSSAALRPALTLSGSLGVSLLRSWQWAMEGPLRTYAGRRFMSEEVRTAAHCHGSCEPLR